MPNVVTHGLMALDVYNQIESSRVKSAIKAHPKAYLLGSNGPDILFYYQALPWQNETKNKRVADVGHAMHSSKINEFYDEAFRLIHLIKDKKRQDILISFMAGHLQHWALDSLAHPFVFYRSGPLNGKRPYDHYRYESMIDALMLTYVKNRRLKELKVKRLVDVSKEERRIIATFYQRLIDSVLKIQLNIEEIEGAIVTMKQSLTYLYSPNNIMFDLVSRYERRKNIPWKYSSHIVSSRIDAHFDVLNLRHDAWCNPSDPEDISTQSFIDIYNQSIDLGIQTLDFLENKLENKEGSFETILQGKTYDTGKKEGLKMQVYDSIYLKDIQKTED